MVLCKYFLRGTCRFGENCKNEHCYTDSAGTVLRKKPDVDTSALIKAVSNDMDKAEKGNQWPLSCYGPFQGKPSFPGFEDKCFEEVRLEMYEAERNGTTEQYKQQLTLALQDARMKMRSLQNPTPEATNVLKELFNANSQDTPIGTGNSIFGSQSTFGSPVNAAPGGSIFNTANNPQTSSSIFKVQTPATNPSNNFTFALPENKTIFNALPTPQAPSIFNQAAATNQFANTNSIFGGATPQNQSIFAPAQPQTFGGNSVFKSNPVAPTNIANYSQSIFGTSTQTPVDFGAPPNAQIPTNPSVFGAQIHNSPFSNQQISSNPSPFGAQSAPPSYPGAQPVIAPPVYGAQPVNNAPAFGIQAVNNPPAFGTQASFSGSIFAQNPTSATQINSFQMNQSPFGAPKANTPENNVFATATSNTNSIFGNPAKDMSQFHQVVSSAEHSKSIFGTQPNTQGFINTRKHDDPTIYSKLEDLIESDIKCYEARTFEFGKIPEKAPTIQLCS